MAFCCGEERSTGFCPTCGKNLAENPFMGLTERNLHHLLEDAKHDLQWASSSVRDAKKQVERLREDVLVPAERRHDEAQKKAQQIYAAIRYAQENNIR